jgi:hypothetical protein
MQRECPACRGVIKSGETVIAAVKTIYKEIPSKVAYALSKDMACRTVFHVDCYEQLTEGMDE